YLSKERVDPSASPHSRQVSVLVIQLREVDLFRQAHRPPGGVAGQRERARSGPLVPAHERQPGAIVGSGLGVGIDMIEIGGVKVLKLQRLDGLAADLAGKR